MPFFLRERLHRAFGRTPLAGVAYDAWSGELDLHRFVESPVDAVVGEFAESFARLSPREAARARAALSGSDLWTLFAFARRSVLASLQGRERPSLANGIAAVSAIELDRSGDRRDVWTLVELLGWALARSGVDHAAGMLEAATGADPGTAEALTHVAERPVDELEPGMWVPIETPAGPALAGSWGDDFEPTFDIVAVALAILDVIEADTYRVSGLSVEASLPDVWLTGDAKALAAALERVRAGVDLRAELDPAAADTARDQHFVVFLVEAASDDDAALLASAAVPTETYEALGVAAGRDCCVVVARSYVAGVPSYERPGALERFREPLERTLAAPVGR